MFIDKHFNNIVSMLASEENDDINNFIELLDGITAVSVKGLYGVNYPLEVKNRAKIEFPSNKLWFEDNSITKSFGVLYCRIDNHKIMEKYILRSIRKIKQGKNAGVTSRKSPSFKDIHTIELFRVIYKETNRSVIYLGSAFRLMTKANLCRDYVVISLPDDRFVRLTTSMLANVLDTQERINTINASISERARSDEIARLHTPKGDKGNDLDFEYRIVNVDPTTRSATTRQSNPNGGGWKLYEHTRKGYTCTRRYKLKDGTYREHEIVVGDYKAGYGVKTVHKDYRVQKRR